MERRRPPCAKGQGWGQVREQGQQSRPPHPSPSPSPSQDIQPHLLIPRARYCGGGSPRRTPVPSPNTPDPQLKQPAGGISRTAGPTPPGTRPAPSALGSPGRAGRGGRFSTGNGAAGAATRPQQLQPSFQRPRARRPGPSPPTGRGSPHLAAARPPTLLLQAGDELQLLLLVGAVHFGRWGRE